MLTSAVMNLLHNGFKNTPAGGRVALRARAEERHLIAVISDTTSGCPRPRNGQVAGADRRA